MESVDSTDVQVVEVTTMLIHILLSEKTRFTPALASLVTQAICVEPLCLIIVHNCINSIVLSRNSSVRECLGYELDPPL